MFLLSTTLWVAVYATRHLWEVSFVVALPALFAPSLFFRGGVFYDKIIARLFDCVKFCNIIYKLLSEESPIFRTLKT